MSVEPLTVDYYDGRHPQPRRVRLHIVRDRIRLLDPDAAGSGPAATLLELPLAAVEWPARTRHGARIARIAGGGELHAIDVGLWDAWAASHGLRRPLVVRVRLRWRIGLAVLLFLALLAYGLWRWGVPRAGRSGAAVAAAEAVARHGPHPGLGRLPTIPGWTCPRSPPCRRSTAAMPPSSPRCGRCSANSA